MNVELFTGGENTGALCFDLPTADAMGAVLALDFGDNYLYFATG